MKAEYIRKFRARYLLEREKGNVMAHIEASTKMPFLVGADLTLKQSKELRKKIGKELGHVCKDCGAPIALKYLRCVSCVSKKKNMLGE
jgi:RNA polymerase-binding transcription factor DksA